MAPGHPWLADGGRRWARSATVMTLAIAVASSLVACGDGSGPDASPSATKTGTRTIPTVVPTVNTASPETIADCHAVRDVLAAVSETHPNGPNLTVGQAPSADNLAGLQAIHDGFEQLDLVTDPLQRATATANRIIEQILAAPESLLTDDVVTKFTNAGTRLTRVCAGTSGASAE